VRYGELFDDLVAEEREDWMRISGRRGLRAEG